MENVVAGVEYTFSGCNGPGAFTWALDFTIIAPSTAVDAFGLDPGSNCEITWTASESGLYLIVVNEAGQCGGGPNTATNNGFPAITCTPPPTGFLVGGMLTGLLEGNELVIQNNSGDDKTLIADGAYVFDTALNDTDPYDVTIITQPTSPNQNCVVSNGAGNIMGADVVNVDIACDSLDLIFRNGFQ